MKRTNIYLSEKQHRDLNRLSDQTGLSVAEHVRRAIDAYLLKHKTRGTVGESIQPPID